MTTFNPLPDSLQGVIFDMDGLMLDTEPIYWDSMQQAARELGCRFNDEWYAAFLGRSIPAWRDTLMQTFGADYPQFRSRRRQLWERHVQELGVPQKAGLDELLTQLGGGRAAQSRRHFVRETRRPALPGAFSRPI